MKTKLVKALEDPKSLFGEKSKFLKLANEFSPMREERKTNAEATAEQVADKMVLSRVGSLLVMNRLELTSRE